MATNKSIRLEKQHEDAIEDLSERGIADNPSEAHRMFLTAGMREYGYESGQFRQQRFSRIAAEFARGFAWIGIAWLALTVFFPVEFRIGAVFALLASLGCVAVRYAAEEWDIGVSKSAFSGEKA